MAQTGLREATPEDNDALRALEASAPQGTGLRLHSERRDYLYRGHLFGNHRTIVAVDHGRVFGVLGATLKRVRLPVETGWANDVPVAMFYDLRLDPAYRTTLLGRHMLRNWLEMEMWAQKQGARIIYGMVKADNTPMLMIQKHKEGYRFSGQMVIAGRPVFRRVRVEREPEHVDLNTHNQEMGEEVCSRYGHLPLYPAEFRHAYLTEPMRESGLFSCYRLSRGESWASVGLYRVSQQVWTRVVRLPWYYRIARPLTGFLHPVVPLPRIPKQGDRVLHYHLFNHIAHGPAGMQLWSQIVRYLNNIALNHGITLLTGMFDPSDPFFEAYRRGAINRIDYRIGYRALGREAAYSFSPFAADVRDMD